MESPLFYYEMQIAKWLPQFSPVNLMSLVQNIIFSVKYLTAGRVLLLAWYYRVRSSTNLLPGEIGGNYYINLKSLEMVLRTYSKGRHTYSRKSKVLEEKWESPPFELRTITSLFSQSSVRQKLNSSTQSEGYLPGKGRMSTFLALPPATPC